MYSLVFAEIGIRDRSSTALGLSNGTAAALYRVVFRESGITDFKDRCAFHLDCATEIVRVVPGEGRAIDHQFGVRAIQPDHTGFTAVTSFTADRIVFRKLAAGDRDNGCSADRDRTAALTVSGCIGIVFQEVGIRDRIFRACAAIDEERTARSVGRTGTESVSFKFGVTDVELHILQPHSSTTDLVTDYCGIMHKIAVVHVERTAGLPNNSAAIAADISGLQDQIVQGKCSGSRDLEDSLAGFAEGDLAVFRHGHGVAAVQRHSAVIGFDAVCIHILQGTVDGQGAGHPCGDIECGSDLDRGSFRAPVHILGEGDGAAAEIDREGDRFPQGVFAVIGINRICGGGHDQAGGIVSAHGVEPCPATVCAGDVLSGFRIGQERVCLNGDPFRAVVILEVVGPVHLELDPAGQRFIEDGQHAAGHGEFLFPEDLFQGGPGFCAFRHEDGIGICRGGGGRVNAGVEIDRSGGRPFQNGVIHVCTAADRVDHIRTVVRDRGPDDDHRAVSVDIDGICRRVAEDFRIGDKGGSAPGTEHIRRISGISPAGDQQIALIEHNAVLCGMSGEHTAGDGQRAAVVDGAAVELCRIAVKHSVGDRGGSGGMDRAAVAGGVVAAINAVPVEGSAIDGETAGAVNGAAIRCLAVADIHIGQRERAGVVDGTAVALARVPVDQSHIADGHTAARRNGEDLHCIAAGDGKRALIDPVAIH